MRTSIKTARVAAGGLVLAALSVLPQAVDAAPSTTVAPAGAVLGDTDLPAAQTTREIYTDEVGVRRPTGLSWNPDRQTLMVIGALAGGGSKVVAVTPGETVRGTRAHARLADGATAAYDPDANRVGSHSAHAADPAGSTYSPDGTLHVLDAATNTIINVSPDGAVDRVPLTGLGDASLRGLAYQPRQDLLYVADTSGVKDTLYAVDSSGTVVRAQDLTSVKIANLQAMTFAPSADRTDPATDQSLFVADAGTATTLGRVAEVNLAPAAAAAATVTPSGVLVHSTASPTWNPTSPDPAGITFLPGSNRLLVSDSEVDEIQAPVKLDNGVNLFHATLGGSLGATGTTYPAATRPLWSIEPAGVSYASAGVASGHLFVSDDDRNQVFEVLGVGADGDWGTSDDLGRTSTNTAAFGSTDAEDVGYDSKRGQMLVVDGVNNELYRVTPGANGFDGVLSPGDDVATHTDLEKFGIVNPEGVAYDAVRDTVLVVDSQRVWELDTNGALMNSVTLSGVQHGAGITVAPSSTGAGRSYYVVDRGADNNIKPDENDGRLFEIPVPASLPSATGNRPPLVNAGPDQVIDRTESAQLSGSGSDDGGSAGLSYAWSKVSGPGTVIFSSASAPASSATFSSAGDYVLRLTGTDAQGLSDKDDLTVSVFEPGAVRTVTVPIAASSDDAQEGVGAVPKATRIDSPDDELGSDGIDPMVTGLRFAGLPVSRGSQILNASIRFQVDELNSEPASFTIKGEAADNAARYPTTKFSITSRPTVGSVAWTPAAWTSTGQTHSTPELSPILQAIVDRSGWAKGNAAAFVVSGTGRRTAYAFDGGLGSPKLVVTYRTRATNSPPVVSAGPDRSVELPASVALDGTVTDDGLPTPPGAVTTTWSMASGPGTVTFADAAAVDTSASFSAPGVYQLKLSGTDSVLTSEDTVVVTVTSAVTPSGPPSPPAPPGGSTPGPTVLSLQTSAGTVTAGRSVTLSGTVTRSGPLAGQPVDLIVRRAPTNAEQRVATVTTRADGTFGFSDLPRTNTQYVVRAAGGSSRVVTVLVRPRLRAGLSRSSVHRGHLVYVRGSVLPGSTGQRVYLQRGIGTRWSSIRRVTTTTSYRFALRPLAVGINRYRVVASSHAGRTSAKSGTLRLRVLRGR